MPRVFVDFSQVGFLALAGVRVLTTAAQRARATQRQLALVVATRPVRRALRTRRSGELRVPLGGCERPVGAAAADDGGCLMKDMDNDHGGAERAEWGLRRYVQQVALGLGVGLESACCESAEPASAYLALTQRLLSAPDRDVALFWDATHGWALGIETGSGEDVLVQAYLGSAQLLADPGTVVGFAKTLLAGHHAGQPNPPQLFGDDLPSQLTAYALAGVG